MDREEACVGCPWFEQSYGFADPQFNKQGAPLLIGDCAWKGTSGMVPYPGRAGDVMTRLYRLTKSKPTDYNHAKVVQCRPVEEELWDNDNVDAAVAFCRERHLQPIINKSGVLVPLGGDAIRAFIPDATELFRGYVFRNPDLLGTYDPNMVGEGNMARLFTMRHDLLSIREGKVQRPYDTWECCTCNSYAEFEAFYKECQGADWIVVDIETAYTGGKEEHELVLGSMDPITRCSFSTSRNPRLGISVPWDIPYTDLARKILALPCDKIFWNQEFDAPRLILSGFPVAGRHVDAMHLWHFLQPDLPMGLAHVAPYFTHIAEWKSKASETPDIYSATDSYVEAQCYLGIMEKLKSLGMWDIAQAHVVDLMAVLERMCKRGLLVDKAQLLALRESLTAENASFADTIQNLYPDELKPTKWYKRIPKEIKAGGSEGDTKTLGGRAVRFVKRLDGGEEKWGARQLFNPNSSQQLQDYFKHKGWKIPRHHKTKNPTVGEKHLTRIYNRTHDELLHAILEFKERDKVINTYTVWPLDKRDFVHPQLRLIPATGRLSCVRPNFQNIPKEGPIADALRACILARPGHALVAADFTGLEAYITGVLAGDELYTKLASKNIYVYVMAHFMRWGLPDIDDPDFVPVCSQYKAQDLEMYKRFKCAVLGISYLEGARTLFEGNPGVFEDFAQAAKLRRFVLDTFPLVEKWQMDTIARAAKEKRLFNPYRYVRWFFDVPGSESPAAVAQQPQSIGAAMIKGDMLILDKDPLLGPWMVLQIHDELVWDLPLSDVEAGKQIVTSVMSRPRQELGNRGIMVKVKVGPNLRDMA